MTTTTTEISRLKLTHPNLGYDGGSGLHALLASLNTKLGDNINTRLFEFPSIGGGGSVDIVHNFGVGLTSIDYVILTGSGLNKTAVTRQTTLSTWNVAEKVGFEKTTLVIRVPLDWTLPRPFSVALSMRYSSTVVFNDSESPNSGEVLVHGIDNKVNASSDFQYVGQQLRVQQGTLALPGYSFTTDTDTGMFSGSSNNLALVTQALERLSIGANGEISVKRNSSVAAEAGFASNVPFASDTATATFGGVGLGRGRLLLATGTSETNIIDAQARSATTNPTMLFRVKNEADAAVSGNQSSLFQWNSNTNEVLRITRDGAFILNNGVNSINDIKHIIFNGNTNGRTEFQTKSAITDGSTNRVTVLDGTTLVRAELGAHKNGVNAASTGFIRLDGYVSTTSVNYFMWYQNGNLRHSTVVGDIGSTSGVVITAAPSDIRLKSDVQELPYALNEVNQLEPIRYTMNDETELGFSAQALIKVIPEAVTISSMRIDDSDESSPADKHYVHYQQLVPVLVKAIQELSAKVDAQSAELAYLKSRL